LLKAQLADCSLAIQHVICSRAPVGY
jgi:hypothetical protein